MLVTTHSLQFCGGQTKLIIHFTRFEFVDVETPKGFAPELV